MFVDERDPFWRIDTIFIVLVVWKPLSGYMTPFDFFPREDLNLRICSTSADSIEDRKRKWRQAWVDSGTKLWKKYGITWSCATVLWKRKKLVIRKNGLVENLFVKIYTHVKSCCRPTVTQERQKITFRVFPRHPAFSDSCHGIFSFEYFWEVLDCFFSSILLRTAISSSWFKVIADNELLSS